MPTTKAYPPTKTEPCQYCNQPVTYRRKGSGIVWPKNNTRGSRDYWYTGDPCQCVGAVAERKTMSKLTGQINGFFGSL